MKCPHCGQEHPDNFQFCPITGKKISQLIACTNKQCLDYGKHILPADSKFCPICGKMINKYQRRINNSKYSRKKHQGTNKPVCNPTTAKLTIENYCVIGTDCISCGTCIDECPAGAIKEGSLYEGSLYYIDSQECRACGTCVDICPAEAISFKC